MTPILKLILVGILASTSALAGCMGDDEEATGDETDTTLDDGTDTGPDMGTDPITTNDTNETAGNETAGNDTAGNETAEG